MEHLKKEYLQAKLDLSAKIIEKHFSDWNIKIDEKIRRAVQLLNCFGFKTTMSCEGHIPPYKGVDVFRLFWPYVQIELIHNTKFHLEEEKPRMETVAGNAIENFRKLNGLIAAFNRMKHPFSEKHLEVSVLTVSSISTPVSALEVDYALKNHLGLKVLVCDVGVQGILTMPQELLNNDFRKRFLRRTQHQMELFTKFLEWRYTHPHHEEEKI